jgi:hypothetical protein
MTTEEMVAAWAEGLEALEGEFHILGECGCLDYVARAVGELARLKAEAAALIIQMDGSPDTRLRFIAMAPLECFQLKARYTEAAVLVKDYSAILAEP